MNQIEMPCVCKGMVYADDNLSKAATSSYIRQSMATPLLEREDELALAKRWRDDEDVEAMQTLIAAYGRLVIAHAAKFRHYGLPMADLIQEGNMGLLQAISKFDPDRDIRFSTYSAWWIRSFIQDFVLRNWSIVRTGTTSAQKSLFFNLRRLRAKIEQNSHTEGLGQDGREEIANTLGVPIKDVEKMETRLAANDQSLNLRVGEDDGDELQNFLTDDAPNPEDIVIGMKDTQARSQWLNQALQQLSDREQKIIRDRHLSDEGGVTLERLGNEMGVSKERIRQLEQRAMEKLRQTLGNKTRRPQDMFLED